MKFRNNSLRLTGYLSIAKAEFFYNMKKSAKEQNQWEMNAAHWFVCYLVDNFFNCFGNLIDLFSLTNVEPKRSAPPSI